MNSIVSTFSAVTYSAYESQLKTPHHRKCIDGTITGCGKCVGYCQYQEHPGFLTKDLRKEHNCIKKGCYYYLPKVKRVEKVNSMSAAIYTISGMKDLSSLLACMQS